MEYLLHKAKKTEKKQQHNTRGHEGGAVIGRKEKMIRKGEGGGGAKGGKKKIVKEGGGSLRGRTGGASGQRV